MNTESVAVRVKGLGGGGGARAEGVGAVAEAPRYELLLRANKDTIVFEPVLTGTDVRAISPTSCPTWPVGSARFELTL